MFKATDVGHLLVDGDELCFLARDLDELLPVVLQKNLHNRVKGLAPRFHFLVDVSKSETSDLIVPEWHDLFEGDGGRLLLRGGEGGGDHGPQLEGLLG